MLSILSEIGNSWEVVLKIQQEIEEFTCIMYGETRETSVNLVRAKMMHKMVGRNEKLISKSKVDLARIPPCLNSLKPHIERVNYRVACLKQAHTPIFDTPKPDEEGKGWMKNDICDLEPIWSHGDILPQSLVDLVEESETNIEEFEEEDIDFDEILEYLDDEDIDDDEN